MYKIFVYSRNDLKIILIATSIGGIVQYFCAKYVKNHPEIFEQLDSSDSKKPLPIKKPVTSPFLLNRRGGAIITISITGIVIHFGKMVVLLKGYGTVIFLGTATSILTIKKIPITAVSTTLRFIRNKVSNGSPISHTDWGKTHIVEIDSLGECSYDFKYFVSILLNKEIPYSDRNKKAFIILKQQLNSGTMESLVRFLACVVSILVLFTVLGDTTSAFIMMQNLLEALREGKISKRVARILIRKLIRKGVPIDPELLEAVAN